MIIKIFISDLEFLVIKYSFLNSCRNIFKKIEIENLILKLEFIYIYIYKLNIFFKRRFYF